VPKAGGGFLEQQVKPEYLPFSEEMIPAAGKLLAARHTQNRMSLSLLPERFEDLQVTTRAVEAQYQKKYRNGYAAFRNGQMVAYLLGEYVLQPWGRCGYVYLPGYALAENESPAMIQDLYARLGDDWVLQGAFSHGLYISAADAQVITALFDLGFGKERVDALVNLHALDFPETEKPAGITIRQAGPGDNAHLGSLSDLIMRALAQAPYWHPTVPEDWEELREGWSELAGDDDWTVWLALQDGEALGTVGFTPQTETDTDMLAAPKSIYLSVAATKPASRGRGISTSLTWHGLEQAREAGFAVCYTNWISPNLLASRHWLRYGFREVAYRLAKRIAPMISWAKAS
jgi:GNAT superfamily N-acetyltransferase